MKIWNVSAYEKQVDYENYREGEFEKDFLNNDQKEKIVSELKESGKYETIVCIDENNDIETIHVK
jgi:hypothetical protein